MNVGIYLLLELINTCAKGMPLDWHLSYFEMYT